MGKFRDLMDRELRIRGYSDATRESYVGHVKRFVGHFMRPPDELSVEHVNQYQLYLTRDRELSWSSFNVSVCALRFFYGEVLRSGWDIQHIPYRKTGRKLPQVLSGDEILGLFQAVANVKHRTIFMTIYAAGLRSSEALHLRASDIDSQRMVVRVDQGKGRRDRYVMLSEKLLSSLRRYWLKYRPRVWLFPGQSRDRPLTRGSLQTAFLRARKAAGLTKRASPRWLRHSFATHLLERGVNIRVIQQLLGHRSLRSTEIYTHVARTYLKDTRSPLDGLLPAVTDTEPEKS